MNMGWLRLTIDADDDGTAELFARFEANGFSGKGSAWFDLIDLQAKADDFGKYPLQVTETPFIQGGYWKKDASKEIEQEHLHISAYPINLRGGIGMRIRAATPFQQEDASSAVHSASIELKVTYEQLGRFSSELKELARGNLKEVILEEAPI